jgi:hypothetical protein
LHLVVVEGLARKLGAAAPPVFRNEQKNSLRVDNWARVSSRGHLITPQGILFPTADDRMPLVWVEVPFGVALLGEVIRLLLDVAPILFPPAEAAAITTQRKFSGLHRRWFGVGVVCNILRGRGFPPRGVTVGVARC